MRRKMEAAAPSEAAARSRNRWTLVLASLAVFMTALDTLVVTTALPVLRVNLHASLASLEWTVNAYNLCFACLLLTGAALGDRFGRRRTFTVGLSIFTAASAAAALSPGYSPLGAGVRLLPWTMPPMVIAPIAGVLADRYGNRPFMVLGLALRAVG
jgi:MFS family permease